MSDTAPVAAATKGLKTKLGPLPLGVWAVAAGGVLGLLLLMRNRRTAAATSGDPYVEDFTTNGGTAAGAGNLAGVTGVPTVTGATGTEAPTDNDGWRTLSLTRLIAGGYDALASNTAISKWLDGEQLDATEQAIVRAAMTLAGPSPQAPPAPLPGVTYPDPAPAPEPAPVMPAPDPVVVYLPAPSYVNPHATAPAPAPSGPTQAQRDAYLATHEELAATMGYPVKRWTFLKNHPIIAGQWAALGGSPGHP